MNMHEFLHCWPETISNIANSLYPNTKSSSKEKYQNLKKYLAKVMCSGKPGEMTQNREFRDDKVLGIKSYVKVFEKSIKKVIFLN